LPLRFDVFYLEGLNESNNPPRQDNTASLASEMIFSSLFAGPLHEDDQKYLLLFLLSDDENETR
jgi:hypothetical protein